jgi:hypothetical protein
MQAATNSMPSNQFEELFQQVQDLCQYHDPREEEDCQQTTITQEALSESQAARLGGVITHTLLSITLDSCCWELWLGMLQHLSGFTQLGGATLALELLESLEGERFLSSKYRNKLCQLVDTLLSQEEDQEKRQSISSQMLQPFYVMLCYNYNHERLEWWKRVVTMLLRHGADLEAQDECGTTVLMRTLWLGGSDTDRKVSQAAMYLLELGAKVNQGDCNGITPLMLSAQVFEDDSPVKMFEDKDEEKVFLMLLERVADLDQKDNQGYDITHHLKVWCLKEEYYYYKIGEVEEMVEKWDLEEEGEEEEDLENSGEILTNKRMRERCWLAVLEKKQHRKDLEKHKKAMDPCLVYFLTNPTEGHEGQVFLAGMEEVDELFANQ